MVQGRAIGMAEVRFLLSQIRPATTGQRDVVELWLQKSGGDSGTLPSSIPDEVISAAVQQWIERLIVLSFLERQQLSVPRAKVEADLQSWDQRLRELGTSLDEFRQTSGISRESLFQFRHWELSWQSYLDRRLTEESLQKYFQQFQAEFDGTQKRVAHIVLVMPADVSQNAADQEARSQWQDAACAKLQEIREQIIAGGLTFSAAAAQYSEGTSAQAGGELGWVVREGPLSEAVSQSVFRLNKGETSEPVTSPHGVHLLTVLEEVPGARTFSQVIEKVKQESMRQLWQKMVAQERSNLSIESRVGR